MKKVSYGIIGTGMVAAYHAQALALIPDSVLTGVCDTVPERARVFAEKYHCRAMTYDEMMKSSEIQAVTIATPSGTHAKVAVPMAGAGKHIFCEKPLDITVEAASSIIESCRSNRVLLSAAFPSRYGRAAARIREAVLSGKLGTPVLAGASGRWYRAPEYYSGWHGTKALDGGGALMNQGIHTVDLLLFFNGDVDEVYARTSRRLHTKIEVEDTASAFLAFRNGSTGYLEASTACAPGFDRRIELSGTRGSIVLDGDRIDRWRFAEETPEDEKIRMEFSAAEGTSGGAGRPDAMTCECHRRQLLEFNEAILGRGVIKTTGEEGLRAVKLVCAVYESARTGKPVKIQ